MHVQSLETAPFIRGGKVSPSRPITEEVLQHSTAVCRTSSTGGGCLKVRLRKKGTRREVFVDKHKHTTKGENAEKHWARWDLSHSLFRLGDDEGREWAAQDTVKEGAWPRSRWRHSCVACFQWLLFSTSQVKHCCSSNFMLMHRAQSVLKVPQRGYIADSFHWNTIFPHKFFMETSSFQKFLVLRW